MRVTEDEQIRPNMTEAEVRNRCYHYYGKGAFQGFLFGLVMMGFAVMIATNAGGYSG